MRPRAIGRVIAGVGVACTFLLILASIWYLWAPTWWPDLVARVGPTDELRARGATSGLTYAAHREGYEVLVSRVYQGTFDLTPLRNSHDPTIRWLAVALARAVDPNRFRNDLIALAADIDPDVRLVAINGLGHVKNAASNEVMIRATADTNDSVRAIAVSWLKEINDPRCLGIATAHLDDPAYAVRVHAMHAVAALGGESARALLLPKLEHATDAVEAALALCEAGGGNPAIILEAIRSFDAEARLAFRGRESKLQLSPEQDALWRSLVYPAPTASQRTPPTAGPPTTTDPLLRPPQ